MRTAGARDKHCRGHHIVRRRRTWLARRPRKGCLVRRRGSNFIHRRRSCLVRRPRTTCLARRRRGSWPAGHDPRERPHRSRHPCERRRRPPPPPPTRRPPASPARPASPVARAHPAPTTAAAEAGPLAMTCASAPTAHVTRASAATAHLIRATVILTAPGPSHAHDLPTAAELAATAAIAIIRACEAGESRDFWRKRTGESAERLTRSRSESSSISADRSRIERAAAAAAKLRSRNRFAGFGALFAKLGPFDAWIFSITEGEILRPTAFAGVPVPAAALDVRNSHASALTECFLRQTTILHAMRPAAQAVYDEDRTFARFGSYVCVPFENGAIALAAHTAPDAAIVARIEALAARLNPLIANWLLEAETDRLRRLVRNLGLRMFGAIDSERARIARDLHDHQAQLLAAARIGIEAGPDEARGIFKQLEDALRMRVRELKPPTLGRSTLADGLRYELRRLADTGIKGRLLHADKMNI